LHRYQSCQSAPLGGWLKKGEYAEAIGRSRGGRTSKIHALADDRGRPVAFALTPGNVADITMAIPLLGAVDKPKRLLADKMPTVFVTGSSDERSRPSSHQPPPDAPHTRSIKRSIAAAMSSSACSAS